MGVGSENKQFKEPNKFFFKRNWSSDRTPNVGRKRTLQTKEGKHSTMTGIRRRKPS